MKSKLIFSIVSLSILYACSTKPNQEEAATKQAAEIEKPVSLRLEKLWESDTLLTTAESVIYDSEADLLYVSNVNGYPLEKDGNGFISQVDMDGNVIMEKWITELDAPKGMGMKKGKLYVTNITQLVEIDIERREITNRWEVEGAIFLNDIAITSDGTIYFTDSETNKIHTLKNGEVNEFMAGDELGTPNGVLAENGRLMLATMGSGKFGFVNLTTKEFVIKTDSIGDGDGVTSIGDGNYLVSSWSGEVFHINGENWERTSLLRTKQDTIQSADITFVVDEKMLLVPTFFNNTVAAYRLIEEQL